MARKNSLGGIPIGTHVQNPDGRDGRVTKSNPDDIAVDWNNGHGKRHAHNVKTKRYPEDKTIVEAPGDISAAASRFGQRAKNAAAMAGAAMIGRKASNAEGKQRTLDTATRLASDWIRFAGEQGIPHTFMNIMEFLRTQHGWEANHNTFNQLAGFMKTGKIDPTKKVSAAKNTDQNQRSGDDGKTAAAANPQPETQEKPSGTVTTPQGTTGSQSNTQGTQGNSSPAPMVEPKVDTQSQPTQPGTEPQQEEPEVGDLIQVTINGEDQFEKPRKITRDYGTGWYGVEGSNSGVTKDQIKIIQKGNQPKPEKQRFRVQAGSAPSPTQESYVDVIMKSVLMENEPTDGSLYGIPNSNTALNRKQIDGLMTIVARDMLRRGMIDYNYDKHLDGGKHYHHRTTRDEHDSGYVRTPNGGRAIAVNSSRFNELLAQAGVTQEELYRIQELGRRFGNDPEDLAVALRGHDDGVLAKKVMAAAIMSLRARITPPHNNGKSPDQ